MRIRFQRYVLMRGSLPPRRETRPGLTVGEITNDNYPGGDVLLLTEEQVRSRLSAGDRCFVAAVDGETIGCLWATTRSRFVRGAGVRINLSPMQTYFYWVETRTAYRKRGVFSQLLESLSEAVELAGIHQGVALVERTNAAMRSALNTRRFEEIGGVTILRVGQLFLRYASSSSSELSGGVCVGLSPAASDEVI